MDTESDNHEWVDVAEAARRLGVSTDTVRRRIDSGRLTGERVPRSRNSTQERWVVWLPKLEPSAAVAPMAQDPGEATSSAESANQADLAILAEMAMMRVDWTQEHLATAEKLQGLERENGVLQGRLQEAQRRIQDLTARADLGARLLEVGLAAITTGRDSLIDLMKQARRRSRRPILG